MFTPLQEAAGYVNLNPLIGDIGEQCLREAAERGGRGRGSKREGGDRQGEGED